MTVPLAGGTAASHDNLVPCLDQVAEDEAVVTIPDDGATGDGNDTIATVSTPAFGSAAGLPLFGPDMYVLPQISQAADGGVSHKDDTAALTAAPTVRSPSGHIPLASE